MSDIGEIATGVLAGIGVLSLVKYALTPNPPEPQQINYKICEYQGYGWFAHTDKANQMLFFNCYMSHQPKKSWTEARNVVDENTVVFVPNTAAVSPDGK